MKKIKLLAPLLGLTAVTGTLVPLTSCGNPDSETNTVTFDGTSKTIDTTEKTFTLKFKLGHSLSTGQTLEVGTSYASGGVACVVDSSDVSSTTITVVMKIDQGSKGSTGKFKLDFTCKKDRLPVWTVKSDEFTVNYN